RGLERDRHGPAVVGAEAAPRVDPAGAGDLPRGRDAAGGAARALGAGDLPARGRLPLETVQVAHAPRVQHLELVGAVQVAEHDVGIRAGDAHQTEDPARVVREHDPTVGYVPVPTEGLPASGEPAAEPLVVLLTVVVLELAAAAALRLAGARVGEPIRIRPGRAVVARRDLDHGLVAVAPDRYLEVRKLPDPRGRLLAVVVDGKHLVEIALDVRDDVRQPAHRRCDRVDPARPLDRSALSVHAAQRLAWPEGDCGRDEGELGSLHGPRARDLSDRRSTERP